MPIEDKNKPVLKEGSNSAIKESCTKKKRNRNRDNGTSSDEERWLDAIESGKLENIDDELKKIKPKDPKLMTARQRAMYEKSNDKETSLGGEILFALPTGYKEKVMTPEAIQKAALKSQKRKQQADEKREQDKKRTIERLLKKQESKTIKTTKVRQMKHLVPVVTYRNNINEITLSYPVGYDLDLISKTVPTPPTPIKCGVNGCQNFKKYSCSRTYVPLCSIECYKRNITAFILS